MKFTRKFPGREGMFWMTTEDEREPELVLLVKCQNRWMITYLGTEDFDYTDEIIRPRIWSDEIFAPTVEMERVKS